MKCAAWATAASGKIHVCQEGAPHEAQHRCLCGYSWPRGATCGAAVTRLCRHGGAECVCALSPHVGPHRCRCHHTWEPVPDPESPEQVFARTQRAAEERVAALLAGIGRFESPCPCCTSDIREWRTPAWSSEEIREADLRTETGPPHGPFEQLDVDEWVAEERARAARATMPVGVQASLLHWWRSLWKR